MASPLLVILGPTASGKTRLATHLAHKLNGEIISADSRQVYQDMNIGTGKDLSEYVVAGETIPYHLIDIIDAGEKYNVYQFQQDFQIALADIQARQKQPILCGGTGLYIEAVLKDYAFTAIPIDTNLRESLNQLSDNELLIKFNTLSSTYTSLADTSTRKRLIRAIEISTYLNKNIENKDSPIYQFPHFQLFKSSNPLPKAFGASSPTPFLIFGLDLPAEIRRKRITKRLEARLNNGMIDEVENLLAKGILPEQLFYYGLEYKFITQFIVGQIGYDTMKAQLNTAIHQFAKRQMTYFRKMERGGLSIRWLDATLPLEQLIAHIECIKIEGNEIL